jgi:hypothetical protein
MIRCRPRTAGASGACRGLMERESLAHAEHWVSDGEFLRELHGVAGKVRLLGVDYCMWEAMMRPGACCSAHEM